MDVEKFHIGNYDKTNLMDVSLHHDKDGYFLRLTYKAENESGIYEVVIPRVKLNIWEHSLPLITKEYFTPYMTIGTAYINVGFGEAYVEQEDGAIYTVKQIESKTHKMTLSEVEKKLGYKIELVSDK